jgi:transcriptional regulator with XRE-family HTH domain
MLDDTRTHLTGLEALRRALGWSQEKLAEHLGPGFSPGAISLIEAQRLKPSPRQQERLREVFGDQAEAMLGPIDPERVAASQVGPP